MWDTSEGEEELERQQQLSEGDMMTAKKNLQMLESARPIAERIKLVAGVPTFR